MAQVTPTIREPEGGWWEEEPEPATVTVAVVRDRDAGDGVEVVSHLASIATDDELVVVFGHGAYAWPGHEPMMAGLRSRLPRHDVVALDIPQDRQDLPRHLATLARSVEAGSLPVVVTPAAAMYELTAEIASSLRADRVLRVLHTLSGTDLYQVWRRRPEPALS